MEIGTYEGVHARQMIETANLFYPMDQIEYYGFDLFEDLTDENLRREFSVRPPTVDRVRQRLGNTGAQIHLFKGYTKDTLPKFCEELKTHHKQMDLVFIDGGHAIETIALDWSYVQRMMGENTIVIFDDYYNNSEKEVSGVGCQSLIDALDRNSYDVEFLKPEDPIQKEWGTLKISMAKVRKSHPIS